MRIRTAGNSATLSYRYVISLCEGEEGGSVVEPFYKKKYIGRKVGGGGRMAYLHSAHTTSKLRRTFFNILLFNEALKAFLFGAYLCIYFGRKLSFI